MRDSKGRFKIKYRYVYLVHIIYMACDSNIVRHGRVIVKSDKILDSLEDIYKLENQFKKENKFKDVQILNYTFVEDRCKVYADDIKYGRL